MAASHDTVRALVSVVRNHVEEDVLRAIARDLRDVPGNASFRETTRRIADLLEHEHYLRDKE